MRIVRSTARWLAVLLAAATLTAGVAEAQSTKMPSTLRWGSGYLDVPSASVLPHLAITVTGSGFWADVDRSLQVGPQGQVIGYGDPVDKFYSDATLAFGLFDRVELGAVLHSLDDDGSGTIAGGFGRLALLRPEDQGLGLAVGTRAVTDPDYDPDIEHAPNRLGIPDPRFRQGYGPGSEDVNTNWSHYVVASLMLRGFESDWMPEHDFTFSAGWGNGLFKDGDELSFYRFTDSNGWFTGAAAHLALSDNALLNIMSDWNGFDVNLGAQLDIGGLRLGAHYLGTNYLEDVSVYRSPKWGVLAGLALCPAGGDGFLCKAELIERPVPDTIRLPAPPPDTVVVTREVEPPLPTGSAASICLATGEAVQVLVTAQGDTLVGPSRTSIRELRQGGVVFAGDYAAGRDWFENNEDITFDERSYQKSGGTVRLECPDIMRVGEYQGVPLFVQDGAEQPYQTLYVPVSPGIWQPYENLRATRG